MAGILEIQTVLAERPDKHLPAYIVARRAGVSTKFFYKRCGKWLSRGHISRERMDGNGWRYYLNEQQLRMFRVRCALGPAARMSVLTEPALDSCALNGIGLVVDTGVVPERLKFLRMLREKTVFGDHATLALIIEDYERTIRLRTACNQRVEAEDKRGLRPTRKAMEMRA